MLAKPTMAIIAQYIQTRNHYAVHQKLMCYMPIISQSYKKKSGVNVQMEELQASTIFMP